MNVTLSKRILWKTKLSASQALPQFVHDYENPEHLTSEREQTDWTQTVIHEDRQKAWHWLQRQRITSSTSKSNRESYSGVGLAESVLSDDQAKSVDEEAKRLLWYQMGWDYVTYCKLISFPCRLNSNQTDDWQISWVNLGIPWLQ